MPKTWNLHQIFMWKYYKYDFSVNYKNNTIFFVYIYTYQAEMSRVEILCAKS